MRNPFLPFLMLAVAASALYLLPDGAFHAWRLGLRGAVARLFKPDDPRTDILPAAGGNRDLLALLAEKDVMIADLNRRLRDIGVSTEAVDSAAIIPAKIIRLGPDNDLDAFTIDAGTDDGVQPGQAVVVGRALAGVVARSGTDASLVLSLASTGCYLSARLGEPEGGAGNPRLLCAVRGVGAGMVRAVVFSSGTAAKEGWRAVTSGLENGIPGGLILGTLTGTLEDGAENGTFEAQLLPELDLTSLDYVTVVNQKKREPAKADTAGGDNTIIR